MILFLIGMVIWFFLSSKITTLSTYVKPSKLHFTLISVVATIVWFGYLMSAPRGSYNSISPIDQSMLYIICMAYSLITAIYSYAIIGSKTKAYIMEALSYFPFVSVIPFIWLLVSKKKS